MIILRSGLFLALWLGLSSAAHAQGTQCRTDPIGSRSSNCASDTFVTDSIAAIPPPPGGTVTSVGTGAGLTGGPITGSGTISVTTPFPSGAWTAWTPTATSVGGAFGSITPSQCTFINVGKWVHGQCTLTINTVGAAGGNIIITVPTGTISGNFPVYGCEILNTGKMLGGFGLNGATTFELRNYDTTSTIGPGNVLNFIVDYQII